MITIRRYGGVARLVEPPIRGRDRLLSLITSEFSLIAGLNFISISGNPMDLIVLKRCPLPPTRNAHPIRVSVSNRHSQVTAHLRLGGRKRDRIINNWMANT